MFLLKKAGFFEVIILLGKNFPDRLRKISYSAFEEVKLDTEFYPKIKDKINFRISADSATPITDYILKKVVQNGRKQYKLK